MTLIYATHDTSTTCQLWLTNDSSLHADIIYEYQGHGILTYKEL